jgi:hypothetical protein
MNARTMKAELMRKRLLAAGKHQAASDSVPFAFERRIMAHLGRSKPLDPWLLWNRILWRFAGPCVALTLLAGALSWFGHPEQPATENLIIELETVLYAPLSTTQEVW